MKQLNLGGLKRMAEAAQRGEQFIPGCTGKRAYSTREEARDMARRRKEAGVQRRMSIYQCKTCHEWHITSHTKKGKKKGKK